MDGRLISGLISGLIGGLIGGRAELARRVEMAAWNWRAAWTPRGHRAGICEPFPRMARGIGAPRGRRVDMDLLQGANTTDID